MNLKSYQDDARTTKVYPDDVKVIYPIIAMVAEVGELCGHIQKWTRGDFPNLDRTYVEKELGDILWNVAALASDLDINLNDVGKFNLKKLRLRQAAGTLKGSGDDR